MKSLLGPQNLEDPHLLKLKWPIRESRMTNSMAQSEVRWQQVKGPVLTACLHIADHFISQDKYLVADLICVLLLNKWTALMTFACSY